ncbi:hypothetical protein HN014_10610 [Aquimarina sp. TRL1]|uniref:hypothetical protein n=1 Tax=Aquimarina sp. (strain TRL1) TaxID=2736252 RepID=UPI00158F151A|nr:hypothetical protein [Aquimarina sp. TRL1]QKX05348.1 hypothetical protein HN014_10610 [Aquimarina sp. TRL1]
MKTQSSNQIAKAVIHSIMDRAMQINKECKEHCRDFRIMVSKTHVNTLILRWTTIDIDNIDRPVQCYRYECFEMDGTPQHCSIHYSDQKEANAFFLGLTTLYTQEFAIDHKL